MRRRFHRTILLSGVCLCYLLPPVLGWGHPAELVCAPLPATGPAGQVSVYISKAQAKPGFLCVRIVNGLKESILSRFPLGRLQQWEDGWWWKPGQFRDYQPDLFVALPSLMYRLPPGDKSDESHPLSSQSASPGRYRVCVRYQIELSGGEEDKHETCSAELVLP